VKIVGYINTNKIRVIENVPKFLLNAKAKRLKLKYCT